jgi:hypothetical protein
MGTSIGNKRKQITKNINDMPNFERTLEDIMSFDFSTREIIIEILQNRQIEERRNDIAKNIKSSLVDYKKGKLKSVSAKEALKILNS